MNCSEWEDRIGLYAGGDLAGGTGEVERHLAGCAECREFAAALQDSLTWLKEAHGQLPTEAHFAAVRARVLGQLERGRVPFSRWAWVYGLAAAALVLTAVVGLRVHEAARVPPPSVAWVRPPEAPAADLLQPPLHRSAERKHRRSPVRHDPQAVQPVLVEPLIIKLETDNPDVVIYWIAEKRGD